MKLLTAGLLTLTALIVNSSPIMAAPTPAEEALMHYHQIQSTSSSNQNSCEDDLLERIEQKRKEWIIQGAEQQTREYIQELEYKLSQT
ncbi:hypothetical protein IQ230_09640 [Gloeocapsopsis crepidinum LEGE 06123]|uniref:Uncharacterized protein n=1 Tax=Gloeocapsopsis crepidinum LEGE 06123 TaxID=588587 RepID=A0ABR9URD6_9CHRO|nr:hypothetical protein [Gloeocapsopsis crepidinum]MBE9190618.1 hypothetical protein [Gloeocapsopsis crepidinum LEGE 06123]